MSKYLKVAVLIVFGVGLLGAEDDFSLPSVSEQLTELKAKVNNGRDGHNYVEVNNQSEYDDLVEERGEDLGISVEDDNTHEVINIVKIRNVSDRKQYLANENKYLHSSSSEPDTNLGVEYKGDVSNRDITNVVDIQNSSLSGSHNNGISISTNNDISGASIHNSTTTNNSSIGNDK